MSSSFVLRLGHVQNSSAVLSAGFKPFRGEDVTHKRCSGCFELDLVQVELEVMLGETIMHVDDSAVMVLGGICQRFTSTDDSVVSNVHNAIDSTEDIMKAELKFLRR